jgi:hypothetical protein
MCMKCCDHTHPLTLSFLPPPPVVSPKQHPPGFYTHDINFFRSSFCISFMVLIL